MKSRVSFAADKRMQRSEVVGRESAVDDRDRISAFLGLCWSIRRGAGEDESNRSEDYGATGGADGFAAGKFCAEKVLLPFVEVFETAATCICK